MPPQPGVFNMRCAHYLNPGLYSALHRSAGPSRVQSKFLSPPLADASLYNPYYPTNTDFTFDFFLNTDNAVDDTKRERKRKEIAGRLGREMGEHRDECVFSFFPPILASIPASESSLIPAALTQCREALCRRHHHPSERWYPTIHSTGGVAGIQPTTIPTYDRAVCIAHTNYNGRKKGAGDD